MCIRDRPMWLLAPIHWQLAATFYGAKQSLSNGTTTVPEGPYHPSLLHNFQFATRVRSQLVRRIGKPSVVRINYLSHARANFRTFEDLHSSLQFVKKMERNVTKGREVSLVPMPIVLHKGSMWTHSQSFLRCFVWRKIEQHNCVRTDFEPHAKSLPKGESCDSQTWNF